MAMAIQVSHKGMVLELIVPNKPSADNPILPKLLWHGA
jgi:hypothetical protein